jgi:transcriptional regulator with XRE-family HTH domain
VLAEVEIQVKTPRRRVPSSTLRAARAFARVSQEELAGRLQVRSTTISERENADSVPWEVWIAWAYVLGISPDWTPPAPVPPLS